mmetsp:Transcript_12197/g.42433  ORF Transcript_12197/g.42433 Transcript_12197/m.42433 type:complete len:214 (+) Transcript_12197:1387-2028(+)
MREEEEEEEEKDGRSAHEILRSACRSRYLLSGVAELVNGSPPSKYWAFRVIERLTAAGPLETKRAMNLTDTLLPNLLEAIRKEVKLKEEEGEKAQEVKLSAFVPTGCDDLDILLLDMRACDTLSAACQALLALLRQTRDSSQQLRRQQAAVEALRRVASSMYEGRMRCGEEAKRAAAQILNILDIDDCEERARERFHMSRYKHVAETSLSNRI